jgi:hypothetical protein
VYRGGWASKVINLIDLEENGVDQVMTDEFESVIIEEVFDVVFTTGEKIIQAHHLIACFQ